MNTYVTDVYYLMALDTLRNDGGTYQRDVFRTAKLPWRYIVALGAPYAYQIDATHGADAVPLIVKSLRALADLRNVWDENRALGTWIEPNDDNVPTVYVDIVESWANRNLAIGIARERGETAIWDNVANVPIFV